MKISRKNVRKLTLPLLVAFMALRMLLVEPPVSSSSSPSRSLKSAISDDTLSAVISPWFSDFHENRYRNLKPADFTNKIDEQRSLHRPSSSSSTADTVSTFTLDELDVNAPQIPCGRFKCFFPSKSDSTVGFLVIPIVEVFPYNADNYYMVKEWEIDEQKAGREFRHFYDPDAPPIVFDLTEKQEDKKLIFSRMDEMNNHWKPGVEPLNQGQNEIMVIKVHKAPTPHIIVKCSNILGSNIHDKHHKLNTFKQTFQKELRTVVKLISKTPCLINDFQLLVNGKGEIHHIDLDRCKHVGSKYFQGKVQQFENQCVPRMKKALKMVTIDDTDLNMGVLLQRARNNN